MPNAIAIANRVQRNVQPIQTRPNMPLMPNMGTEILNPPPPLVRKLMELQAELQQHFPNNPNVLVAFNGQGGCLIGMEQQAMQNIIQTATLPRNRTPNRQTLPAANVRGFIG